MRALWQPCLAVAVTAVVIRGQWSETGDPCGPTVVVAGNAVIRSPNYPNRYPVDFVCEWLVRPASAGRSIILQFDQFQLAPPDGVAMLIDDVYLFWFGVGRIPSNVTVGRQVLINFRSYYSQENVTGFYVNVLDADSCGEGADAAEQTSQISSPNYPEQYPSYFYCEWHLQRSPQGDSMQIQFESLSLSNWYSDYLQILSSDHQVLYTFYGTNNPGNITVGTDAIIIFCSFDAPQRGSGFALNVGTVEVCGNRTVVAGDGRIQSPNFPDPYSRFTYCEWRVHPSSSNKSIDLEFMNFSLSNTERLGVHNGVQWLYWFYGSNSPGSVMLGMPAKIALYSDNYAVSPLRFYVEVLETDSPCGDSSVISGDGVIMFTGLSNSYSGRLFCEWNVRAVFGQMTRLEFLNFSLAQGDLLQIHSEFGRSYWFSAGDIPYSVTIYPRSKVTYQSSSSSDRWFSIQVSSVVPQCGRKVTDSGNITSPNYPNPYATNEFCMWLVTASSMRSKLMLQVKFFQTELRYDYLYIFSENYDLMYKFHGKRAEFNLTLPMRQILLLFTSDSSVNYVGFSLAVFVIDRAQVYFNALGGVTSGIDSSSDASSSRDGSWTVASESNGAPATAAEISDQPSAVSCGVQCVLVENCQAFTYDYKLKKCYLLNDAIAKPSPSATAQRTFVML